MILFQVGNQNDLFMSIQSAGGIRPRRKGCDENGLYDGYDEAIGTGETRFLVRKSGLAPDVLVRWLNVECGAAFQSVNELYESIENTRVMRMKIRQSEAEGISYASTLVDRIKSELAKKVFGSLTSEQKSTRARNAWATRRINATVPF